MSGWSWIEKAGELSAQGLPFALVTLIACKGSAPRAPGAKMIVTLGGSGDGKGPGTFYGTIGGGRLEELVIEDARKCLAEAVSRPSNYPLCFRTGQCCGGAVEVFVEIMGVGPMLYLFGAGHVGQAVCQTLQGTPFTVHVIDQRTEWTQHADLPVGVVRHEEPWTDFVRSARWDKSRVYVAVMTHDHQLDLDIVRDVIERPARFIGLIGSETKWNRFRQRLAAASASDDAVARVHCPIGLPIGGKAPREVAISVASQLLQLHHEAGGH